MTLSDLHAEEVLEQLNSSMGRHGPDRQSAREIFKETVCRLEYPIMKRLTYKDLRNIAQMAITASEAFNTTWDGK